MKRSHFVPVLLTLCGITYVQSFPNGAPKVACETMYPLHGVRAQQGSSPYTVEIMDSVTTYTYGTPVKGRTCFRSPRQQLHFAEMKESKLKTDLNSRNC